MNKIIWILIILLIGWSPLNALYASTVDTEKWVDMAEEYSGEIRKKLEQTKKFTEEQIDTITECMKQPTLKDNLNCLTDGGVDGASDVLVEVKDAMTDIQNRICGGSSAFEKDRCSQLKDRLDEWKKELTGNLSETMKRGQKYLEERNKLFFMKKKICTKIGEKGCWTWLDDRINIKCDPKKVGTNTKALESCRLDVVNDVWSKLNNQ